PAVAGRGSGERFPPALPEGFRDPEARPSPATAAAGPAPPRPATASSAPAPRPASGGSPTGNPAAASSPPFPAVRMHVSGSAPPDVSPSRSPDPRPNSPPPAPLLRWPAGSSAPAHRRPAHASLYPAGAADALLSTRPAGCSPPSASGRSRSRAATRRTPAPSAADCLKYGPGGSGSPALRPDAAAVSSPAPASAHLVSHPRAGSAGIRFRGSGRRAAASTPRSPPSLPLFCRFPPRPPELHVAPRVFRRTPAPRQAAETRASATPG